MATVKPNSLIITDLEGCLEHIDHIGFMRQLGTYAGTAGAMLVFSAALGVLSFRSSFSNRFFSLEIMRLEVIFKQDYKIVGERVS